MEKIETRAQALDSYEAIEKALREGGDITIEVHAFKGGEIIISGDESTKDRLPLKEVLALYKFLQEANVARGTMSIRLADNSQDRRSIDSVLDSIRKSYVSFSSIIFIDLEPNVQEYLKSQEKLSRFSQQTTLVNKSSKLSVYKAAAKSHLFKHALSYLENRFDRFFTYHSRPKRAEDFKTMPFELSTYPKTAIILQGPIAKADDFTLETVKMYKKSFPHTHIIVSTWEDENMGDIDALEKAGATVVRNKKPPFNGPSNVNFQLASTKGGIEEAKNLGATHIIKSRTDQRMYGTNLMPYLMSLVEKFPVAPGFKQKQRIVLSSFGVCKYAPYYFSDLFMFGHIDDMSAYWNIDYVSKDVKKEFFNPEVHLATWFLEKTGRKLEWTIADSWKAYAEQTIVIDHTTLDLYWLKYDRWLVDRRRNYSETPELLQGALSFHEWFVLYSDLKNIKPLDRPVFFRGLSIK